METDNEHTHSNARNSFVDVLDPVRIQGMKSIVEGFTKQGKEKFYCILVDGEIVVPSTSDPELFDNYERYVMPSTRTVEVRMFFGHSPKFNSHKYKANFNGLSGHGNSPSKEQFEYALKQKEHEHVIDKLESKIKRKNRKIQELEETCSDLEEELERKEEEVEKLKKNPIDFLTQGAQFVAMIRGENPPKGATPLAGGNTTPVEVEVEDSTPSLMDQEFEKLKANYSESQILKAMKNWQAAMDQFSNQ